MVIYLVESLIQPSNNCVQEFQCLTTWKINQLWGTYLIKSMLGKILLMKFSLKTYAMCEIQLPPCWNPCHPNSYSSVNSKPTHPLLPWHLLSICHLFCFKCSNAPWGSQFISIGEDKFWWSFDYVSWKYMEQVFTTLVLWNNAPVESKKKKNLRNKTNNNRQGTLWPYFCDRLSVTSC